MSEISRRKFVKMASVTLVGVGLTGVSALISDHADEQFGLCQISRRKRRQVTSIFHEKN